MGLAKRTLLASAWAFAACSIVRGPEYTLDRAIEFSLPAPDSLPERGLSLWATHYSVPRAHAVADGYPLLDPAGAPLGASVAHRDWCDAAMEGTVQVRTGRGWVTYNFAGTAPAVQVDCSRWYPRHPMIGRSRFRPVRTRFGMGSTGGHLIPFRSIAVDPRRVPYRTVLFIPAARGVPIQLPSGEVRQHDGYFFAADTGGAIKGNHIDVFFGRRQASPFSFIASKKSATFSAYVIDHRQLTEVMEAVHRLD